jgi:hypothetical protein
MSTPYDPRRWYWFVGGDNSKVYSSAVGDYVPLSDPKYVAWLLADNVPTAIMNEDDLGDVLSQVLQRPVASGVLDSYTAKLSDDVITAMTFKILFNHENRIRLLESRPAVTVQQFRAAIKALM